MARGTFFCRKLGIAAVADIRNHSPFFPLESRWNREDNRLELLSLWPFVRLMAFVQTLLALVD